LRRTLRWRQSLSVHIHSNSATRVSHQFLRGFHVLTTSLQQCRKRPAEGMPAHDLHDAGPLRCSRMCRLNKFAGQYGCAPCSSGLAKTQSSSCGYADWALHCDRASANAPSIGTGFCEASPFRSPTRC
jgi:hypothetical protein